MCGDLDDDGDFGEELLATLSARGRPWLGGGESNRLAAFEEADSEDALHLYMDRLFADLLRVIHADAADMAADDRADLMAAQGVVAARLAGLLAGIFPPGADMLKSAVESLMDGYGAEAAPAAHHHH